jgi:uncharacterized protein (DUF1330 family)
MSAYVLARITVTDWDRYQEYIKASPAAIAAFGGRFIARGGRMATLEGPEETARMVLVEFPSLKKAREWYDSEEYQAARELRAGAAEVSIIAVEGC